VYVKVTSTGQSVQRVSTRGRKKTEFLWRIKGPNGRISDRRTRNSWTESERSTVFGEKRDAKGRLDVGQQKKIEAQPSMGGTKSKRVDSVKWFRGDGEVCKKKGTHKEGRTTGDQVRMDGVWLGVKCFKTKSWRKGGEG